MKDIHEVAPPGWSGSVKAMKKHKEIDNPFALAWHMKNKGDHPHYKPEKGDEEEKSKKNKKSVKSFKEWLKGHNKSLGLK